MKNLKINFFRVKKIGDSSGLEKLEDIAVFCEALKVFSVKYKHYVLNAVKQKKDFPLVSSFFSKAINAKIKDGKTSLVSLKDHIASILFEQSNLSSSGNFLSFRAYVYVFFFEEGVFVVPVFDDKELEKLFLNFIGSKNIEDYSCVLGEKSPGAVGPKEWEKRQSVAEKITDGVSEPSGLIMKYSSYSNFEDVENAFKRFLEG